ncbi:MAG: U32 family peptidase [Bacillota bacterium]
MTSNGATLPELLAPAGNRERLEAAVHFGADAVYVGLPKMSLRNLADNFTNDTLKDACRFVHSHGKRLYVACNAFARDAQLTEADEVILASCEAGADALIVTDPGVIARAKRLAPGMELHLSTQANTLNSEAARFWYEQGVRRVVLARELSIDEIRRLREQVPPELELEMFVHGAMCIAYSGRCVLSNYLSGRDSNKGECVQPCRWGYEMREAGSKDAPYRLEEDGRGTFVLNSKDLNLIEYLPGIIAAGVRSLKIEGRMKSVYYVATAVNAYRMALDAFARAQEKSERFALDPAIARELETCSHRPYTTGFAVGSGSPLQATESASYIQRWELTAIVRQVDQAHGRALLEQRNRFFDGDRLEILSPGDIGRSLTAHNLRDPEDNPLSCAPHPKQLVWIDTDQKLKPLDMLRKEIG